MNRHRKIRAVTKTMAKNKPSKVNPGQGNCPPEGDSTDPQKRREDLLKNRSQSPSADQIDPNITLAKLVAPSQNDSTKWSENKGATITGYLVAAHPGGKEACNCHSNTPNMLDIHVELVTDKANKNNENKYFIAELTRYFLDLRKQWTVAKLQQLANKNAKINVTGWLFFDPDHMHEAENTNPGGIHNWRATSWEIHPITSISLA